jgi:hypothetical protein
VAGSLHRGAEHGVGRVMSIFEVTPRERAVWALRRVFQKAAEDVDGVTVVEVPISGMAAVTRRTLEDPLAGVRAALLARNVAARELRDYAEQARGAGRTWDDVAEALGISADEDDTLGGERAFLLLVAGGQVHESPYRSSALWTCGSCGERMTDRGPFESNPDDVEQGHHRSCERHNGNRFAYSAELW